MNNKIYNLTKYLLGWPLSAIALFFIFKIIYSNSDKILPALLNANIYLLLLSIFLFAVFFILRAYLWKMILGEKGNDFNYKEILLNWSLSELRRYIPGNIWSMISKATSFENQELNKKQIFIFIIQEIQIVLLTSLFLSLYYINFAYPNSLIFYGFTALTIIGSLLFIFGKKILTAFPNKNLNKFNLLIFRDSDYKDNFKILLFGIFNFFIFGLAYYLGIVSIIYIDPKNILQLISLSIFAFFIGYVSIITPMGLGVREGALTLGLSNFISAGFAGIISIFTRIIFIISEIISIIFAILWIKSKYNLFNKLEQIILNHKHEITLIFFIFLYLVYFSIGTFLRHDNFYTGRFDLGNMDQTVWNTANGRIFELTNPDSTNITTRLSIHADFILILLAPFYLIWSDPKILLLIQTLVLSFGAIFVYKIANIILKNKNISLVFASLYLLNPAVQYTNLYDFHAVTLATTFLLATYYFFLKKNYIYFAIFALLSAITKEQIWAVIAIFGLFIAFRSILETKKINKEKILGFIIFIFSSIIFYLLISNIIPMFRETDHFALSYFAEFGNTSFEIIKNILLNPLKTITTVFGESRLIFLKQIFSPLGFISFINPIALLLALPDFAINLLSSNQQLHQIYYQYTSSLTPFIFISAIYGTSFITRKIKFINLSIIAFYLILSGLISLYFTGPFIGTKYANIAMFNKQLQNREVIKNYISTITSEFSVSATNNLGSHLSQRQLIYTIPYGKNSADYVVLLLKNGYSASPKTEENIIKELLQNSNYKLDFQNGNFYSFKRLKN